jgi:hypothetical protein
MKRSKATVFEAALAFAVCAPIAVYAQSSTPLDLTQASLEELFA